MFRMSPPVLLVGPEAVEDSGSLGFFLLEVKPVFTENTLSSCVDVGFVVSVFRALNPTISTQPLRSEYGEAGMHRTLNIDVVVVREFLLAFWTRT